MRLPIIPLPLMLTSLCAFAFNPKATRWYGQSALSPSISSVSYQGTGDAGLYYSSTQYKLASTLSQGDFTVLGIEARQSIGWREWFSLELNGSYGGSLNGSGGGFPNAIPASLSLWDLGLEASTSIALDSVGSVYIEPSIGYGWLVANMRAAVALLPRKNWVRTDAYGPSAALYMRLFLTKRISVRFGSKYQASQLRTKSYASGRGSLPAGMLVDKRHSRARRHSLGALMGFDYAWRSWINLHAAVDYQSWSAGGAPQSMNRNYQFNDQATMAPRLERTRFTWGVDFAY